MARHPVVPADKRIYELDTTQAPLPASTQHVTRSDDDFRTPPRQRLPEATLVPPNAPRKPRNKRTFSAAFQDSQTLSDYFLSLPLTDPSAYVPTSLDQASQSLCESSDFANLPAYFEDFTSFEDSRMPSSVFRDFHDFAARTPRTPMPKKPYVRYPLDPVNRDLWSEGADSPKPPATPIFSDEAADRERRAELLRVASLSAKA